MMAYHGEIKWASRLGQKLSTARFMVENPSTWRDMLKNEFFFWLQMLNIYVVAFLISFLMFTVRWFGRTPSRPHDWGKITELAFFGANLLILVILIIFSPAIFQSWRRWYCKIRGIPYVPPKDRSKNKWVILRSFDPRADASSEAKSNENIHQSLDK